MPTTSENCQRCNGTGLYQGTRRDGTSYSGPCFACQGGGPRAPGGFYRRRAYAASGPARAPEAVAAVATAVRTPRQQASLDAFAVAQPAAWAWLVNSAPSSPFAASLLNGIARYGNLTPRQLACVERNVAQAAPVATVATVATVASGLDALAGALQGLRDNVAVATVAATVAVTVDLDRVRAAMNAARDSGLRKVSLTFGEVTMKLSGPTFRGGAGMILCYRAGAYAGFVDTGNVWRGRSGATVDPATLDAFRAVGRDPRAAAATHGRDTGYCACCRRLLTDPPSVMAGIGPVCITRFGWGF